MKKKILFVLGGSLLIFLIYVAYVMMQPPASPKDTVSVSSGDLNVEVVYSRPYKKGRLIFGEASNDALVPWGEYWRLGANEATEITFNQDVVFAGNAVEAGTYRMYAVPDEESWEITLNSEVGKFGYFDPDYDMDVLKIDAPVKNLNQEVEQFTIQLQQEGQGVVMRFIWDQTQVDVPIAAQ